MHTRSFTTTTLLVASTLASVISALPTGSTEQESSLRTSSLEVPNASVNTRDDVGNATQFDETVTVLGNNNAQQVHDKGKGEHLDSSSTAQEHIRREIDPSDYMKYIPIIALFGLLGSLDQE